MNNPQINWALSSKTSLMIKWDALIDPDSNFIGYSLEMYDQIKGQYDEIYNGKYNKEQLSY